MVHPGRTGAGMSRDYPTREETGIMNRTPPRCLLLALGNDLLTDDGVGLAAVGLLRSEFKGAVDVVEATGTGLALLELLAGYDRALLLEGIFTGKTPPGTVLEFSREDFQMAAAPTAHYVGIPEILRQAESLGLEFPRELRVLALELENPLELRAGMSPTTRSALPGYVERARKVLQGWTARNPAP
jgi:hydrogenase maturation protease